jgi:exosome complex protein LRP1
MDTSNLVSLVEHLEDNIDELVENLEPLLSAALATTTKKLPLLDKAKLYVLIVYSIESLLFCEL